MMSKLVTLTVIAACMSLASIAFANDESGGGPRGGMMGDMVSGTIHAVGWSDTETLMGFGILTPDGRFYRIHVTLDTQYLMGEDPGTATDVTWGERVVVHLTENPEGRPVAALVRVLPGAGGPPLRYVGWRLSNWPLSGRYPVAWSSTPSRWVIWSGHRPEHRQAQDVRDAPSAGGEQRPSS